MRTKATHKKLTALLLSLVVVLGMLPITVLSAKAAPLSSPILLFEGDIYRDGRTYKISEEARKSLGVSAAVNSRGEYVYTFNGMNIQSLTAAPIWICDAEATIELIGSNTIKVNDCKDEVCGIYVENSNDKHLTIRGTGSLTVIAGNSENGGSFGISHSSVDGKQFHLTVDGADVTFEGGEGSQNWASYGVYVDKLEVINGRFVARSKDSGGFGLRVRNYQDYFVVTNSTVKLYGPARSVFYGSYNNFIPKIGNSGFYTSQDGVTWEVADGTKWSSYGTKWIGIVPASHVPVYTVPTAKTGLAYTGKAQYLINVGTCNVGNFFYSLTENGTYTNSIPYGIDIGSYDVYWKFSGPEGFVTENGVIENITIDRVNPTYTVPTAKTGLIYTGEAQPLINGGTSSQGDFTYSLTGEEGTYSSDIPLGTDAKTYNIYWKLTGTGIYGDATGSLTASIGKAMPVYTPPTARTDLVYNGEKRCLYNSGAVSGGKMRFKLGSEKWKSTMPFETSAGTYQTYWKILGDDNHLDVEGGAIEVTVAPMPVNLAWTDTSFPYDGNSHAPTATVTNRFGEDDVSVIVTGAGTDAGTYTATAFELTGTHSANYTLVGGTNLTREFTVNAVEPTNYAITVANGIASIDETEISQAVKDAVVTVTANAAPSGKVFDKWVVKDGDVTLADENADVTTFIMGNADVTVEATYKDAAPDFVYGDIDGNGIIQAADARLCLRASVGLEVFAANSVQARACDVDGNGTIQAADARLILRKSVGLEASFPAEEM